MNFISQKGKVITFREIQTVTKSINFRLVDPGTYNEHDLTTIVFKVGMPLVKSVSLGNVFKKKDGRLYHRYDITFETYPIPTNRYTINQVVSEIEREIQCSNIGDFEGKGHPKHEIAPFAAKFIAQEFYT
jgi:hypothetical protein